LVAMGFASVENMYYVVNFGVEAGFVRVILDIPIQALYGVVMGFFFSKAKFEHATRGRNIFLAILVPILLHGTYNFLNFYSLTFTDLTWEIIFLYIFIFVFIISIWAFGLKKIKEEVDKSPFREAKSQKP
jgi:protease PrsW